MSGTPRDRIVILGRRKAGKTVFLARLYEQLWNAHPSGLTMRTLEGTGHVALMEVNERLVGSTVFKTVERCKSLWQVRFLSTSATL